ATKTAQLQSGLSLQGRDSTHDRGMCPKLTIRQKLSSRVFRDKGEGFSLNRYVGSDICGFNGETNEELCLRWQQMGAFHSFMRNHNTEGASPQDPARWPSVAAATQKANFFRYKYLPYLFSLHFAASLSGGTVVRPLFYEFPTDLETHDLGHQFLWGSSMLIAPVVYQGATSVNVYLPEDDWFSLFDYELWSTNATWLSRVSRSVDIPDSNLRGSILPRQAPNVTTSASRQNGFELLVAPSASGEISANGFLYWDDGESIIESFDAHDYYHWTFKYYSDSQNGYLSIKTERQSNSLAVPTIDTVEIFNYRFYPDFSSFTLNGKKVNINVQTSSYNPYKSILYVSTKNLIDISGEGFANLSWKHSAGDSDVWSNGIEIDEKRNWRTRSDLFI
ncbi:glycosyl hydrolase, family 31, partial [Cooperia oncophora]